MMNNRIQNTLKSNKGILTLYFTAGFPQLNDTLTLLKHVQDAGVQMVEIGVPFSDPLADGPVIQESGLQALDNGMNLRLLFEQLKEMRKIIHIPVTLMGYFNCVYVFGMDKFIDKCAEVGIDGIVFPDLPLEEYIEKYEQRFRASNLSNIFLVMPNTPDDRIRMIDEHSDGFIYIVSSASTTGSSRQLLSSQQPYFDRLKAMNLKTPTQIGFGISDADSYHYACENAQGAIVGTGFIKHIRENGISAKSVKQFVDAMTS